MIAVCAWYRGAWIRRGFGLFDRTKVVIVLWSFSLGGGSAGVCARTRVGFVRVPENLENLEIENWKLKTGIELF